MPVANPSTEKKRNLKMALPLFLAELTNIASIIMDGIPSQNFFNSPGLAFSLSLRVRAPSLRELTFFKQGVHIIQVMGVRPIHAMNSS